jgi:hypothetical protein
VNDEGLTVFMLKVYEESRMGADHRGQEYTYEMITLDSNGKMSKFLIDLDEYVIHSGHFEILDTSTLVCGGFYGEKRSQIDGSFYLRIDLQNGEELSSSTRKFDLAFLQEGQSAMKAKRISRKLERGKNAGLVNIYFRDFVLRSDGGVCLIGEYYDLIVTQGNDPNSSSTTSYVYKDIVVISMDPDGHVQWSKKILKRQITTEDGGLMSGFALLAHGDKLYFIFNDHKMNLEVKDYADLRTWSRKRRTSIVTLVTINSEGDLSREMLISQKKLRLELIPMSCRQISENEMILVAYSRKENQIARLLAR